MKILVIGGTGTMGAPLVEILGREKNTVDVISRHERKSERNNTHYIPADALNIQNMANIIYNKGKYDTIIDFMVYPISQYKEFLELYLNTTDQYIFMSTACVYEEPPLGEKITEKTPRLIDSYPERKRHDFQSYHILKSNLDDIVLASSLQNWTMVRPHITFNSDKYLLVLWHKEMWLYRVLHDQAVVLPKDAMNCLQTITYGEEVAYAISKLVGNDKAIGEVINIASDKPVTWQEYMEMITEIMPKVSGKEIKIHWVDTAKEIVDAVADANDFNMKDHLVRREFDISKLRKIAGENIQFTPIKKDLEKCLKQFIDSGKTICPNGVISGYMDRLVHSTTPIKDIKGKRSKLLYYMYRYNLIIPNVVNKLYNW